MTPVQTVDCIISAKWILPIVPKDALFSDCSLIIEQKKIIAIIPTAEVLQRYRSSSVVDLGNHVVMPGLINAHGHAAMTLLRGYADDLPLMTWLEQHIWPAEQQWVDEHFVEVGSRLAIAEMLKSGTTCFSDMYFFPEAAAAQAHAAGLRAQITFPILDFPSAWAIDADDYLNKGLSLHDTYRDHRRIRVGFGPHAPYTVGDDTLKRIATIAEQLQAPIQIHAHETAFEIQQSLDQFGVRPLQRLADLGVLSPLSQCVHMTQVNTQDIALLKASGASVIHCPESNLKLASGLCPVQTLLSNGINVGLGTDGAASNNDLNMFGEIHTAALIGKIAAVDAAAVNARQALEMATIGGARALGMADSIGSLEVGKAADMIALELSHISLLPTYDLLSQLVYNNRGANVTHAWVDGHLLLKDGQLLTMDEYELRQQCLSWQDRIQPNSAS